MANASIKTILLANPVATLDGTEAVYGTQSPSGTAVDAAWLNSTVKSYVLATPTITGHPTIEGVTSTGATGTGKLVFSIAPAFTTNITLGVVSSATGQIKLANAGSANLTTLQAGAAAAARTYTWPTDFGAAGTVLTDAAGNGTLSWAAGSGGAGLGANTFTDTQTITQATANHGIIVSTGYNVTGSATTTMIDLAGTWNTSGVVTAIKLNITNTARGAGSLLLDLQSSATSMFNVSALNGYGHTTSNLFIADATPGIAAYLLYNPGTATNVAFLGLGFGGGVQGLALNNISNIGWDSTAEVENVSQDVRLSRNGTGVLQLSLGGLVAGHAALATNATDGFLYIPTCAGTPSGTPTAFTGMIPMIYDTSAHQFWFYDSGWKQPKTPAGAAIVTWQ